MKGVWHFIFSCFFFRFWSISGGIVSVSGVSALRTNTQGILSLRWGLFGIPSLVFRFGLAYFSWDLSVRMREFSIFSKEKKVSIMMHSVARG